MISRIGNRLFEIGRCLERAEQMASYTKMQYLAAMDAPFPASKSGIWELLLNATQAKQAYYAIYTQAEEEKVLHFIALDEANLASIRATVTNAREMARGARNYLSAELWEHINCFYHLMQNFTADRLKYKGFYNFAQKVEKYSYTIKGYLDSIMLRNEAWRLLTLGYHLERAIQASTILLTNMQEMAKFKANEHAKVLEDYQMRSMLESWGAYEMYKQYYHAPVNKRDFLHFIVFNAAFPKSIAYNLHRVEHLNGEDQSIGQAEISPFQQQLSRLLATIVPQNTQNIEGDELAFISSNLRSLHTLAQTMEVEQAVHQA